MSKKKDIAFCKQQFFCPYCDFTYTGVMPRKLKLHIIREHKILEENWIEFLRNVYWPKYYPELATHCLVCQKPTHFLNFKDGFTKFCDQTCELIVRHYPNADQATLYNTLEKIQQNKKYHKNKSYIFSICNVKLIPIIDLSPFAPKQKQFLKKINRQISQIRKKETCLNKYGVEHQAKLESYQEKVKQNCLNKYGVENVMQNTEIAKKVQMTKENKDNNEKKEIYDRMKQTNLKKYGVTCTLHHTEIRQKVIQTWKEKYKADHPMRCNDIAIPLNELRRERDYIKSFINKLQINLLEIISPIESYVKKLPLILKCKLCGQIINYNYEKKVQYIHCEKCFNIHYSSKQENKIYLWLESLKIEVWKNKKLIKFDNRNKEIDLYLPQHKIGIEIDGLYWHSNIDYYYHLKKSDALYNSKYKSELLHFTDIEVNNYFNIVQSYILSKCNIYNTFLEYKDIDIKICPISINKLEKFINNYSLHPLFHIYWKDIYSLGIWCKNSLSATFSFYLVENKIYITNFIIKPFIKLNNIVQYITDYLFSNYPINKIYIKCDRRFLQYEPFIESGFIIKNITLPRLWYWENKERVLYDQNTLEDFYTSKNIVEKSTNTNKDLYSLGWNSFYDCGTLEMEISK